MMQTLKKYPLVFLFAAFLLIVSVANLLTPDREKSELENRPLAQRPKLTATALLAKDQENKYTQRFETYLNDQFVGRDGWITLKSVSESALGKIENNGIVYGSDNYLFDRYETVDERRFSMNIELLGTYLASYRDTAPITVAVIPNSYEILADKLPKGLQNVNQAARVTEIYSALPGGADTLDLFPVMRLAASERQAYYRTDHHWTTWGAYNAYRAFVESRGLKAVEFSVLEPLRREAPGFYGTYFSKCKLFSAVPDTIEWYDIPVSSVTVGGEEKPGLYDAEKWGERDKHAAFLWGNSDLTVVKSENNLNHQEGRTSRVLLIKDSYGNPFAPFLTYSYDEVWMVDLRNLTAPMSEVMARAEFDDVLVMYNFENFAQDSNFTFLNR